MYSLTIIILDTFFESTLTTLGKKSEKPVSQEDIEQPSNKVTFGRTQIYISASNKFTLGTTKIYIYLQNKPGLNLSILINVLLKAVTGDKWHVRVFYLSAFTFINLYLTKLVLNLEQSRGLSCLYHYSYFTQTVQFFDVLIYLRTYLQTVITFIYNYGQYKIKSTSTKKILAFVRI